MSFQRYNNSMVGIDIVQISRIKLDTPVVSYILTDKEMQELEKKSGEQAKLNYAAGRFAAKEAIFKATQDRGYLQYSILTAANGAPYVDGHPEISISISHDGGIAAAIVMIL